MHIPAIAALVLCHAAILVLADVRASHDEISNANDLRLRGKRQCDCMGTCDCDATCTCDDTCMCDETCTCTGADANANNQGNNGQGSDSGNGNGQGVANNNTNQGIGPIGGGTDGTHGIGSGIGIGTINAGKKNKTNAIGQGIISGQIVYPGNGKKDQPVGNGIEAGKKPTNNNNANANFWHFVWQEFVQNNQGNRYGPQRE